MKPTGIYAERPTPQSIVRFFQKSRKRHLFLIGARGSGKSTLLKQLLPLLSAPGTIPGITSRAVPGQYVLMEENGSGKSAVIGRYCKASESSGASVKADAADISSPAARIPSRTDAQAGVSTSAVRIPGRTDIQAGVFNSAANVLDHADILAGVSTSAARMSSHTDAQAGLQMLPVSEGFFQVGIPAISHMISSDSAWSFIDEIGYLETGCPAYCAALEELLEQKSVLAVLRRQDTPLLEKLRTREDVFLYDLDRPLPRPGCILMASGTGRRFGGNKLLASFGKEPLVARILSATDTDLFAERIVVTRHPGIAELCRDAGIRTVLHDLPYRSDTIRLGLEALADTAMDGCMFCPCDQPLLTKASVEALAASFIGQPGYIYRLACGDIAGSPVLFPADCFPALKNLPQGKGGSWLLRTLPHADDASRLPETLPHTDDASRLPETLPHADDASRLPEALLQDNDSFLPEGRIALQVRRIEASSPLELRDIDTPEDLRKLERQYICNHRQLRTLRKQSKGVSFS